MINDQESNQKFRRHTFVVFLIVFGLLLSFSVLFALGTLIKEISTKPQNTMHQTNEVTSQPVPEPETKETEPEIAPVSSDIQLPPEPVPEEPTPKPGEPKEVKTPEGLILTFRWCPPGKFMMGAPISEWRNRPRELPYDETPHEVELTKGFWLLQTPVTQVIWRSVMGNNPSQFKISRGPFKAPDDAPNNPVEKVSWDDCQEFCRRLSAKLGAEVKLPTEAQWEYACRAGNNGPYAGPLDSMAWYKDNSSNKTHGVGEKSPNDWGICDMHGNVWEWCSDWYDKDYYKKSPAVDPENTTPSHEHVTRGGCCNNRYAGTEECRSANRGHSPPSDRGLVGFRVILIIKE